MNRNSIDSSNKDLNFLDLKKAHDRFSTYMKEAANALRYRSSIELIIARLSD